MRFSVVIPALNESEGIRDCLVALGRLERSGATIETVVSDGGSTDATPQAARAGGAKVVESPRGRGPQMNAGAAAATGEVLLFLHADTRLPHDGFEKIGAALEDPHVAGGAFNLAIAGRGWFYRFTAWNANIRSKLVGAPYGDQAYFVRRSAFEALGGYRDLSNCEDLDFVRRLRKQGRVVIVPAAVSTSARRWEKHGRTWVTVRNGVLFFKFWLGLLKPK